MKKLSINELETTVGGGKLRTCFLAGVLTIWGVNIGLSTGNFYGAGTVFIAGLGAANYNGCLD